MKRERAIHTLPSPADELKHNTPDLVRDLLVKLQDRRRGIEELPFLWRPTAHVLGNLTNQGHAVGLVRDGREGNVPLVERIVGVDSARAHTGDVTPAARTPVRCGIEGMYVAAASTRRGA
eukprot:CAMPEP_0115869154 /NCGR_PEP_ID=MMETSP0287-20121206/21666_1 /TAXON_ID=412157 /ORGANISM="Chrysochromulina rotalis, Strain UIO044" /LENGTH=119 /DNA_ID=CAMNT_0003323839 /DNA_START=892 /DNA_END=1249 /DNA_ORIENTATION=+